MSDALGLLGLVLAVASLAFAVYSHSHLKQAHDIVHELLREVHGATVDGE